MAERNFAGLRETIEARFISRRDQFENFKNKLYKLIDELKIDEFYRMMRNLYNSDKKFYKIVLFYGIGPPSEVQSLWINLIKCNRLAWMKGLAAKDLMSNLQPIMLCLSNNTPISSLNYAIELQNPSAVKFLLELQTRNFNGRYDIPNQCPCFVKCVKHWNIEIAKILIEFKIDVNQTTKSGNTGLHFASKDHRCDAVEFLIEHKADVNIQNSKGKTPLHLAVNNTDSKLVVKKLLDVGAVLLKDKLNHTPLFYAVLNDTRRTEPSPLPDCRSYKRRNVITPPCIHMAKELCQTSDLIISDIVSMLSMNLVPLHDSERYCNSVRLSMLTHIKHGIKPILHSQFVKYPEAKNVFQVGKIDENPILQVLYSSVVWTSASRTSINNATMRSRLILYLIILLNSSTLDQCYKRHLKSLISNAFQCFLHPFPPASKEESPSAYLNRILRQTWKEFTCLIMLTQHYEMPLKENYLTQLELYLKDIILPIFRRVELLEDIEPLYTSLELICIPVHLFLYLWWQTTRKPSGHYFKTFDKVKKYIDYFYQYYLMRHDILTSIVSITCYNSHKLSLNTSLRKTVGHELGNFAMIQNNSFDVKITDLIDFLVDLEIDMNFRSPITGNSGLHVAAKEVLSNELLHLLNVGTYPLTLDRSGNTFYQYAHDNPDSFQEDERKMILSHPSIEGLAPPKLETLCALVITKSIPLCQYVLDYLPNTRYSKLLHLHLIPNCLV